MPGEATKLGPFTGGLHNSAAGEFIDDKELYELVNLEVDNDGSLVNRPEIRLLSIAPVGITMAGCSILGVYLPNDGRKFLIVYTPTDDKVSVHDIVTGKQIGRAHV